MPNKTGIRTVRKAAKLLLTQSLIPRVTRSARSHMISPGDAALQITALECYMVGDMILASDGAKGEAKTAERMLMYGSFAFLAGHLCLIASMYRRGARLTVKHGVPRYALLIPPVAKAASKDRSLAAALGIYGSTLCTMSAMTADLANRYKPESAAHKRLVRGGWSFIISDALIAVDALMGADKPKAIRMLTHAGIDVTYACALWSLFNGLASSDGPTT